MALAAASVMLSAAGCTSFENAETGTLSAENAFINGRLYHAARISDTFQYIEINSEDDGGLKIETGVPCAISGCTHTDDSCPAYIRGLTCWAASTGALGDVLWYAQMRSYIDTATHKGVRHNVIARLETSEGVTDTLLADWQYEISQILLYGDDIYFLSKNSRGLRDVWVMPQSGGTPTLYIENDGVNILIIGMENGAMFILSEDGGVFRADTDGGKIIITQLMTCGQNTGIFLYDGYIYYPFTAAGTPEFEFLNGRTEQDSDGAEAKVAVAVNCRDYYRIPAGGGEPEHVISNVQPVKGNNCLEGVLYLPVWDYEYYGSKESSGKYTDYFTRSLGRIATVKLNGKSTPDILIDGSELDFIAVHAVTGQYIIAEASNPKKAYADGSDLKSFYYAYNLSRNTFEVININTINR